MKLRFPSIAVGGYEEKEVDEHLHDWELDDAERIGRRLLKEQREWEMEVYKKGLGVVGNRLLSTTNGLLLAVQDARWKKDKKCSEGLVNHSTSSREDSYW
jgi:hypothetical protein